MNNINKILVTGGLGYIGSHTAIELLQQGCDVLLLDNLCNSQAGVVDRIRHLGGPAEWIDADLRDTEQVQEVLIRHRVDCVLHFAALKSVPESLSEALRYYDNNVGGLISLLQAMRRAQVERLVLSSSAAVYGQARTMPETEAAPLQPQTPYVHTKAMAEQIIMDHAQTEPGFRYALLRYFNPAGAHPSGELGDTSKGLACNLMTVLTQVAAGQREALTVFGRNHPTPDGTCVRDYLHVLDLAQAHVLAMRHLDRASPGGVTLNLGRGVGVSVKTMIDTFQRVNGVSLKVINGPARANEASESWADPALAHAVLGWKATRSLAQMCQDAWRWQCR